MRIRRLASPALLCAALAVPRAAPLAAQAAHVAGAATARAAPDSQRAHRAARRAQQAFEATRRTHLPVEHGSSGTVCDLRVGRFCYWQDDDAPTPREPEVIARARARLLSTLDTLAAELPGDEWIAGQRVRYLVEAGRPADAATAAAGCRAAPWWCAALAGLALHAGGEHARADSAFDAALRAMPAEERCRWTDVALLLDGEALARWRKAGACGTAGADAAREAIAARLWWLAQPFHALGANDLRAEHLARRTMARIDAMATAGYDGRWGRDNEELLLRFGWPIAWSRHPSSPFGAPGASVVGHDATPSFHFLPGARLLDTTIAAARDEDWSLRRRGAPARYAPAYLRALVPIGAQVAAFRRGDSALVVAGVRVPERDTLLDDDSLRVALAVSHAPGEPIAVAERRGRWRGGALSLLTRAGPALASVEVLAPARRAGGRQRAGVASSARGRIALSDLLFYAPDAAAPASVEDALPRVLGEPRAPADRRVGVLWETYGLAPAGEPLSVTLTVERVGMGWAERAAQRVGLLSRARPLDVRWTETPDRRSGAAFRALAVDLTHLAPGRYVVRLAVTGHDGARAVSARELVLPER